MASIPEILSRRYFGTQWSMSGDDYASLVWYSENTVPKPSEAELRALSANVDLEIERDARRRRQDRAFSEIRPDALLVLIETLADAVDDLQSKLRAASLTSPLAPAARDAIVQLKARITAARGVP